MKPPDIFKPASIDNPVVTPDKERRQAQYKLDGAWLGASDYDPSEIGPENFNTLDNMRYGAKHPEGVSGYTVLNDTAIDTYTGVNAGIQLRTNRDSASIVLVQADEGAGTGKLFYSTDAPPAAMTLTALTTGRAAGGAGTDFTDTSGNTPRLSVIPRRQIAYSNEDASYIWAGPQMDVAAFFLCDNTSLDNPRDYYKAVKNTSTADKVAIAAASTDVFTVHSTRPLDTVWISVVTPNGTVSTLTGHVYTAAGWVALGNPTDGTAVGGKSLAQSGAFVFDSTVATAARMHFEGTYFYAYRFQLSAGSAEIYHVQVGAPFQPIVDVWDGVPRNFKFAAINFSGKDEEFTAHIVESSSRSVPIGMLLDGLTSSDAIFFMPDTERLAGIQVTMLADLVNTNSATLTGEYWDGDSWVTLPNFVDGTASGGKTFAKSGLLAWTPPAASAEFPVTRGWKTGYMYRFVPSATLTGTHGDATDSVVIDMATGVPAPLKVGPYRFHSTFKGRHLGCGAISEKEGNRIDFTAPHAPDVWNGLQSSNDGYQSAYLGEGDDLTCGMSLYNRYGSVDRLFEVWVGFTKSATYQLKESSSEERIFEEPDTISDSVGCPAPASLVSTNIGVESGPDQGKRNMLLWVSASGPYSYDGSYLERIKGFEKYFDPNESLYVGADLSGVVGWFDPVYREYNFILPGDVWLAYDLEKKRGYKKNTGSATTPSCGWNVVDSTGGQYTYGGLSTGEVARLEYGTTWDGTPITQEFRSGDFWPSENIWDVNRILYIKLIARAITEDHDVEIIVEADTEPGLSADYTYDTEGAYGYDTEGEYERSSPVVSTVSLKSDTGSRIVQATTRTNYLVRCLSIGCRVTTSDTAKGLQPLGLALVYKFERMDK